MDEEMVPTESVEQPATGTFNQVVSYHYATRHWRIEDFLVGSNRGTKTMSSPEFPVKSLDPDSIHRVRTWQLELVPQVKTNQSFMAIHLNLMGNTKEFLVPELCSTGPGFQVTSKQQVDLTRDILADFQISILNKKGETVKQVACKNMQQGNKPCIFLVGTDWHFNKFLSLDSLISDDLLVDNRDLLLKCEIWTKCHQDEDAEMLHDYRHGGVWWKDNGLGHDFGPLENELPDVLIHVESSEVNYPAHRMILQKSSPAFAAKLREQTFPGEVVVLKISDFDEAVVRKMLDYVYWGHLDSEFAQTRAPELFQIAHEYCLLGLREICQKTLVKDLDENNCMIILDLSERLQCGGLSEKCLEYMAANWKEKYASYRK